MSGRYICKIASLDEMERKWAYEIDRNVSDRGNWMIWREAALENFREGKAIPYYGILDGEIICEATAVIYPDPERRSRGLVDEHTAYLEAFRTNEPFIGQGYFSRLFAFMLADLRGRGYRRFTVGVETGDEKNRAIYAHYGFTEHIRTETEQYPDGTEIQVEYYAKKQNDEHLGRNTMDYRTEQLILHFVTEEDVAEVARAWWSDHRPVSEEEAKGAIAYMRGNYEKNAKGRLGHLCLAVCRAEDPGTIIGWCGLDGSRNQTEPEIFILLDEEYRNQGYGTQCVRELLRIAAEDYSLRGVHGGCFRDNIASMRAMEKGGMIQYGTEENGDPLFRFSAGK